MTRDVKAKKNLRLVRPEVEKSGGKLSK